ncbi:MAG: hypothetical protein Fur0037_23560 [Planctomycetota bacterium]
MTGRDPFAAYRERLAAMGFRPSSALGQNFLLDPSLHRFVAKTADPSEGDLVLEVGVGLGFLTRELLARGAEVIGVEIDRRLHALVERELEGSRLRLIRADVLGGEGGTLHPEVRKALAGADRELLVVANLPYSVSGPLIAELCALDRLPRRMVLLLQRELAERLCAAPAQRTYGGLSVLVQSLFRARIVRRVGPEVFRPRPKVDSAILLADRLAPPPEVLRPAGLRREYAAFARTLFGKRRKVLRATLGDACLTIGRTAPLLPAAFLSRRAEALGPVEILALFEACLASDPDPRAPGNRGEIPDPDG